MFFQRYTRINQRMSVNSEVSTHILWQKAYCKLPALLNRVREHSQKGLHQELHQPLQYLWWVGRAPPHRLPLQVIQSSPPSCAVVIWETVHITLKLLWIEGSKVNLKWTFSLLERVNACLKASNGPDHSCYYLHQTLDVGIGWANHRYIYIYDTLPEPCIHGLNQCMHLQAAKLSVL